jgi:hypothetical protein
VGFIGYTCRRRPSLLSNFSGPPDAALNDQPNNDCRHHGGSYTRLVFDTGWSKWGITIAVIGFGGFAAIQVKSLMNWINQLNGTADYIVLDKVTGEVALPRVGLVLSKMEIKRIVELVPDGRSPHQIAVLIKDDVALQPTAHWVYAYVFSSFGGTSSKLAKKLADGLSIPLEKLSIPYQES